MFSSNNCNNTKMQMKWELIVISLPAFLPKTLYLINRYEHTRCQLYQWCRLAHKRILSFRNILYYNCPKTRDQYSHPILHSLIANTVYLKKS